MKRLLVFLTVMPVLGSIFLSPIQAQTGNVRILLHVTKPVSDSGGFGWDAWFVAPNVTTASNKWLVVTGPRINGRGWWSEFNFGAFVQGGKSTPSVDVRTSWPSPEKFSFWTDLEWNNFSDKYIFAQADYKLPKQFGMVGLETEGTLPKIGVGPQLVIPFGSTAVTSAYQFARGGNQLWFRLAINLR